MNPSSTAAAVLNRYLMPHETGFDYARTVLEINRVGVSYEKIAEFCGYESKSAIADIASGCRVPSHPHGEAIYILFVELFGRKPPLNVPNTERSTGP